jgi:CheY-like chemotaxis protein
MKPVILMVDDEKVVLDSLVNQLKRAFGFAFKYETALGVGEAWEVLEDLHAEGEPVALIISDWLMPPDKGDYFLIQVTQKYPAIPQIMLSGFADEASVERAKQNANLKEFIAKPWDEQNLINKIKQIVPPEMFAS